MYVRACGGLRVDVWMSVCTCMYVSFFFKIKFVIFYFLYVIICIYNFPVL